MTFQPSFTWVIPADDPASKLVPLRNHGIKTMSIGYLLRESATQAGAHKLGTDYIENDHNAHVTKHPILQMTRR